MAKVFCALLTVAAASAVQVDVGPAGPASLTQLGAQQYTQPHAFTAPLPIAQPIDEPIDEPIMLHNSDIETYDYKPILIKYVEPSPQLYIDDDVDDDDDASDSVEYVDGDLNAFEHGKVSENGAGTDYVEKHHKHKGEKSKKKYSSKDLHATGESGNYNKQQQEGYPTRPENDAHRNEADSFRGHLDPRSSFHGGGPPGREQFFSEADASRKYNEARSSFHGGGGPGQYNSEADAIRKYNEARSSFHGGEGPGQYISEADAIRKYNEGSPSFYGGGGPKQEQAIRESGNYNQQQQEGHISEARHDNDAHRDFYDVADNIGHFNTYGNEKGRHGSKAGGDKEGGHSFAGFYKREFGKASIDAKGHHDASDISLSAEEGKESNDYHSDEYGKKGDKGLQKEYTYEDDDDDEDDDEDHE